MTPFGIGARVRVRDLAERGTVETVIRKGALCPIIGYRVRLDAGDAVHRMHDELTQVVPFAGDGAPRPRLVR